MTAKTKPTNGTRVRRSEGEIAYAHGTQLLRYLAQEGLWEDVQALSHTMKRLKPTKAGDQVPVQAELPLQK